MGVSACRVRRRVRGGPPRRRRGGTPRSSSSFPFRLHANSPQWIPPLRLERHAFLSRRVNAVLQARRRAALPRLPRRARRGADQRPGRPRVQRAPRHALGPVRLPGARGRPRGPAGAARRRRGLAARARPRPHDRADGLHDERRERRPGRGLRPRADDPPALAPAATTAPLCEDAGLEKAVDLLDVGARDLRPRAVLPILFELAEQVGPKHGIDAAQDDPALAAPRPRSLRRDLQRGVEPQLGLRAVLPRRTSTPTPRAAARASTRRGSWSPSEATSRGRRDHGPRRQPGAAAG